jgi:hypothetical protein
MDRIRPILADKQRGEELLDTEITEAAFPVLVLSLTKRIAHYFMHERPDKQGIRLNRLPGRGWALLTDPEQHLKETVRGTVTRMKSLAREQLSHNGVDPDKLTSSQQVARDARIRFCGSQRAAEEQGLHQHKVLLGAPTPRPLLLKK